MKKIYNNYNIDTGEIYRNESSKFNDTDLSLQTIKDIEFRLINLFDKYELYEEHDEENISYLILRFDEFINNQKYRTEKEYNPFLGFYMKQYANENIKGIQYFHTDADGNINSPLLGSEIIDYDPNDYCYVLYDFYDFDNGIIITSKNDPDDYPFFFSLMLRQFTGEERFEFLKYQFKQNFERKWPEFKRMVLSALIDHSELFDRKVIILIEDWIKTEDNKGIKQPVLALFYYYLFESRVEKKSFDGYDDMSKTDAIRVLLAKYKHLKYGNKVRSINKFNQFFINIGMDNKLDPLKPKYLIEVIPLLKNYPLALKLAENDLEN